MIFNEKGELVKRFEIYKKTEIAYVISTFLNILNRWDSIRIYVFCIEEKKNEKK